MICVTISRHKYWYNVSLLYHCYLVIPGQQLILYIWRVDTIFRAIILRIFSGREKGGHGIETKNYDWKPNIFHFHCYWILTSGIWIYWILTSGIWILTSGIKDWRLEIYVKFMYVLNMNSSLFKLKVQEVKVKDVLYSPIFWRSNGGNEWPPIIGSLWMTTTRGSMKNVSLLFKFLTYNAACTKIWRPNAWNCPPPSPLIFNTYDLKKV